jgi:NAD(P)-dependent dehydrogenase (short-subunit alcohol dehydrogenase family)
VLAVNLKGALLVAQSAARMWIGLEQRDVSISFTSSIACSIGLPMLAPYAASKGGINQLVRTLAVEWAEHGIRVNAVAPGYVQNIMSGLPCMLIRRQKSVFNSSRCFAEGPRSRPTLRSFGRRRATWISHTFRRSHSGSDERLEMRRSHPNDGAVFNVPSPRSS